MVADGLGVGEDFTVVADVGVAIGVGSDAAVEVDVGMKTPLFQIKFFPDFTHVNFLPAYI